MALENMVIETRFPIIGITVLANYIQDELAENYEFFSLSNGKELYYRLMGLTEIVLAAAEHLEKMRNEFSEEVERQYS